MKRLLAVGVASFCLLSNLGFAEASIEIKETKDLVQTKISEAQAKDIALKQVKGKVVKVELETDNGVLVYEVDVKSGTQVYEVKIDAKSGKVLKVEKEND
ncbi:peptidase M4 [Bacillus sp. DNRA2]|uniref:PepSY domain-containing protein n=1 Tax=Bacillus sp. DNRA2 TaxID=2723053 RepID=UPI00145F9D06|nr:PepSY domain-containing protein [Bacillus sp. DNRA2]NMD69365.1 peptidase M4 [Bacillus sp. DNRA2]